VSGDLTVVQPRDAAPEVAAPSGVTEAASAPTSPTPPAPPAPPAPAKPAIDVDETRLEILRALERGEITVAEATDRLGRLDEVLR
jgi:DNA-binding transcriptional ArsR family regulator